MKTGQKQMKFWVNLTIASITTVLAIPVDAYNTGYSNNPNHKPSSGYPRGHNFLLERSLETIKKNPSSIARVYRVSNAQRLLEEGMAYADEAAPVCEWAVDFEVAPLLGRINMWTGNYGCDTIHHYSQSADVEADQGISETMGNPGSYPAGIYSNILYQQAIKFWPGGKKPKLSELPYLESGFIEDANINILTDIVLLGLVSSDNRTKFHQNTVGGSPLCEFVKRSELIAGLMNDCQQHANDEAMKYRNVSSGNYFDLFRELYTVCMISGSKKINKRRMNECPQWPEWVFEKDLSCLDRVTEKQRRSNIAPEDYWTSMRYLGWTIHLIQDSTTVPHARNSTGPGHRTYETNFDKILWQGDLEHLPVEKGQTYRLSDLERNISYRPTYLTNSALMGCYPIRHSAYNELAPFQLDLTLSDDAASLSRQGSRWAIEVGNASILSCKVFNNSWGSSSSISNDKTVFGDQLVLHERTGDAAVKLTTVLLEKFFSDVSKIEDQFEPNNNFWSAKKFDDSDTVLTLHSRFDVDFYYVEIASSSNSIEIELETHAPPNSYNFWALSEQADFSDGLDTPNGKIIQMKKLSPGRVWFSIARPLNGSSQSKPTAYRIRIKFS